MTQQPHWWAYILRKPEFKSLFKEPFLTILFTLLLCPFPMESPLTLISSNFNLLLHLSSHNDLTNYSIFKIMLVLYVFPCLIAQLVKNLPALQKTAVGLLGQEDPLKKGKERPPTPVSVARLVKNSPAIWVSIHMHLGYFRYMHKAENYCFYFPHLSSAL